MHSHWCCSAPCVVAAQGVLPCSASHRKFCISIPSLHLQMFVPTAETVSLRYFLDMM